MSGEGPILYLIAHKVRGQPAFDIATCEEVEGEEMWIIPTSGHRAYPFFTQPLGEIVQNDIYFAVEAGEDICPPNLRDHYTTSASPRKAADPTASRNLLTSLGLLKPAEPIKRRI